VHKRVLRVAQELTAEPGLSEWKYFVKNDPSEPYPPEPEKAKLVDDEAEEEEINI
jgi:hypothetical protein